ncbi:neo-calmodulin-like isoform X2 [Lineus longissimus]|uniref:neo-calmodulin-like isoform X2 n=1 Tax=Lineus longissimus TaxID=88925 RepID=UPI00315D8CA7
MPTSGQVGLGLRSEVKPASNVARTKRNLTEFAEVFSLYDHERNGSVAVRHLGEILRSAGLRPSDEDLELVQNDLQKAGKNKIDFPEFLKLVETRLQDKHTEEDLRECFSIFDKDMDGKVSAGEVRHALLTLGEKMTEHDVDMLINEMDLDGEGQFEYEDVVKLLTMHT